MTLTRRQLLAVGLGAAGTAAAGAVLGDQLWPLLARENLAPGRRPELVLPGTVWDTTADRLTFAAVGDTGSGGRKAWGTSGPRTAWYGNIEDRFDDVFVRPYRPLIDAGVRFEVAIGNHDGQVHWSDERLEAIDTELRLLGTPARYYTTTHGPADFFFLDSSTPGLYGPGSSEQLAWLDDALATSSNQRKIVCLHRPVHSSGKHGSTPGASELLEPILARHATTMHGSGTTRTRSARSASGTAIRAPSTLCRRAVATPRRRTCAPASKPRSC